MSSAGLYELTMVGAAGAILAARAAGALTVAASGAMVTFGDYMERRYARWLAEQEVKSEWDRSAVRVLDRNARLAVLAADCARAAGYARAADTVGAVPPPLPAPLPLCDQPAGELDAWCAQTDLALGEIQAWLAEAAAADMSRRLTTIWRQARADEPEPELFAAERIAALIKDHRAAHRTPGARGGVGAGVGAGETLADDVARIVARLAPDATTADRQDIERVAARVIEAVGAEARTRLADLRQRVQTADTSTARRRGDALDAAALLHALEPAADEPATRIKAALADVVARVRPLDASLRAEATARSEALRGELDEAQIRAAVLAAVAEGPFELTEDVETLDTRAARVELSRSDWPDHAIAMILDGSEVRSMVHRWEAADGDEARRLDVEREEAWCAELEQLRTRLAERGIDVRTRMEVRPGEQPALPVRSAPRRTRRRAEARSREIQP